MLAFRLSQPPEPLDDPPIVEVTIGPPKLEVVLTADADLRAPESDPDGSNSELQRLHDARSERQCPLMQVCTWWHRGYRRARMIGRRSGCETMGSQNRVVRARRSIG